MDYWDNIWHILLFFGAVGIGYLFKDLIQGYITQKGKNIATKEDIEDITKKIEGIKIQFFEHQTQYSIFYQKRFEVLGKLYELINDPYEHIKYMISPLQSDVSDEAEKSRWNLVKSSFNDLSGYYWKNKIYLPEEIENELEELLGLFKEVILDYQNARDLNNNKQLWKKSLDTMDKRVPEIRKSLELKFREEIFTPSFKTKQPNK